MVTVAVKVEITGVVCKVMSELNATVQRDEALMFVESMKMEIPIVASHSGQLTAVLVQEGSEVTEGETVAIIDIDGSVS